MNELYKEITLTIWTFSIAMPSETLANFILSMNKLLSDTKTAYNKRIAPSRKKNESTTEDTGNATEPEDSETTDDNVSEEA